MTVSDVRFESKRVTIDARCPLQILESVVGYRVLIEQRLPAFLQRRPAHPALGATLDIAIISPDHKKFPNQSSAFHLRHMTELGFRRVPVVAGLLLAEGYPQSAFHGNSVAVYGPIELPQETRPNKTRTFHLLLSSIREVGKRRDSLSVMREREDRPLSFGVKLAMLPPVELARTM